jgi:hypothetical protein
MHFRIDLLTISLNHRQRSNFNDHFKSIHSPDIEIEPNRFETNASKNTSLKSTNSSKSSASSLSSSFSKSDSSVKLALTSKPSTPLPKHLEIVIHETTEQSNTGQNNVNSEYTQSLKVLLSDKPDEIVKAYFKSKMLKANTGMSSTELDFLLEDYKNTYVLNVCGSRELVFGNENTIGFYKVFLRLLYYQNSCILSNRFFLIKSTLENVRLTGRFLTFT